MNEDRELLLRWIEGALTAEEAEALRLRLAGEPALREQLARLESLRGTLAASAADSFAPYFSGRVLRRLSPQGAPGEALYESLRWLFARVAIACVLVALALGAFNAFDFDAPSVIDAVFGLPSVTIEEALYYGAV